MKYKTSELTGIELEFTVRTLIGEFEKDAPGATLQDYIDAGGGFGLDWETCGPIIEHERIGVSHLGGGIGWFAGHCRPSGPGVADGRGESPLVAAMRAFVGGRLGAEVDL